RSDLTPDLWPGVVCCRWPPNREGSLPSSTKRAQDPSAPCNSGTLTVLAPCGLRTRGAGPGGTMEPNTFVRRARFLSPLRSLYQEPLWLKGIERRSQRGTIFFG